MARSTPSRVELVDDPLGGAPDLAGTIGIGADALDREELVKLCEMLVVVLTQVLDGQLGSGREIGIGLARHWPMIRA